jgi:DMSO reductase anchor subunit
MNVEKLRLLFDFGLLVLIWLVQLTIYPAFRYYSKENLIAWHQEYTFGISMVVIPLMFGQLITAGLQLISERSIFTIGSIILIVLVWISTFTQFVPMHNTISSGTATEALLEQLVARNWIRTALWTLIFAVSALKTF